MAAERLPIKICFIAPKAYPLFNPQANDVVGGAEVDQYFLARELAKDDNFNISFITADYGQAKIETVENVKIIKSLDLKKNPLNGALKVWRAMRTADAQIYFQKAVSWGTFLVALFCKSHKRIFIYRTAHQHECDGTYLKRHYLAGKAFSWSLRNAAETVVQNDTDKTKIKQTIGIYSRVIPNAHRLPVVFETQRDIILWVGRSAQFKRPGLFIDLAQRIPSEHFTMICQRATGDRQYDALKKQAATVQNLQFIERVPFNEIDKYFQKAKVLVNTSDSEGFPNVFIQACKCGTPILSLKVNPDNFLDRFNCGICADDRFDHLVQSLESILVEKKYLEVGRKARKYAEERHDLRKAVGQYKSIFERLAGM